MSWVAVGVAAVSVAGTAYSANQQSKASKEASASLGGMQSPDLKELPPPDTVDWKSALNSVIGANYNNLPMNFALANQVNRFNLGQFSRGANTIQPYFNTLQEQIGRNALSYSRGELPSDVVSSLGRAAAQRGLQGGFGMGSRGGGPGTALGSLNLRNLGLTSLQLSQQGTQLGMQANNTAANMMPRLFDPSSMFMTPAGALGAEFQNAGILNDWNRANTGIINAERSGNTELANSVLEAQTGLAYQNALAQAQAVQSASNSVAGLAGGGYFGGGGGGGMNSQGFFNTGAGAMSGANSGYASSTPYGYAVRPQIL